MTLPSVSFYPSESEDVTQLGKWVRWLHKHIEQFIDLTKLEALMSWKVHAPFRKQVIDTQSSQKMISPENT